MALPTSRQAANAVRHRGDVGRGINRGRGPETQQPAHRGGMNPNRPSAHHGNKPELRSHAGALRNDSREEQEEAVLLQPRAWEGLMSSPLQQPMDAHQPSLPFRPWSSTAAAQQPDARMAMNAANASHQSDSPDSCILPPRAHCMAATRTSGMMSYDSFETELWNYALSHNFKFCITRSSPRQGRYLLGLQRLSDVLRLHQRSRCIELRTGWKLTVLRPQIPCIKLSGLPTGLTKAELIDELFQNNLFLAGFTDVGREVKVLKLRERVAILQVPPEILRAINMSPPIQIRQRQAKVSPTCLLVQCFRCAEYGHTAARCSRKVPTCYYCAGNHEGQSCPQHAQRSAASAAKCPHCSQDPSCSLKTNHSAANYAVCPQALRRVEDHKAQLILDGAVYRALLALWERERDVLAGAARPDGTSSARQGNAAGVGSNQPMQRHLQQESQTANTTRVSVQPLQRPPRNRVSPTFTNRGAQPPVRGSTSHQDQNSSRCNINGGGRGAQPPHVSPERIAAPRTIEEAVISAFEEEEDGMSEALWETEEDEEYSMGVDTDPEEEMIADLENLTINAPQPTGRRRRRRAQLTEQQQQQQRNTPTQASITSSVPTVALAKQPWRKEDLKHQQIQTAATLPNARR